jgi:chromosome segregation ATPase
MGRREKTVAALQRVQDAVDRMRREKTPITAAGVARLADVSRTFLYENPAARASVSATTAAVAADRQVADAHQHADIEVTWRERALNAEAMLKTAHEEIVKQRNNMGELMGQLRDLETEWTDDSIQRITTENTSLKQKICQLNQHNQALEERLKAARSNLRFQDRRIAELEVQILDSNIRS